MKSLSVFQIVVLGVFVALTIVGVGVFAAFGGLFGGKSLGPVAIWGTVDAQTMESVLTTMRQADKSLQDVTYAQKSPQTYERDLIDAIAAGRGPDLFLMSQEELGRFSDKIYTIPYSQVSQTSYTGAYIDGASVFLNPQGTWAMPFMVDPLVMYYNRDLLASAGIAQPPKLWSEFTQGGIPGKITSIDSSQNLTRSAVALGAWANVAHAKAILSTLFIQAGDPIVSWSQDGRLTAVFGQNQGAGEGAARSALRFYTEFGNPSKTTYSWNRGLPYSTDMFVAGDLAIYFGPASEYKTIADRNPNLRFGVAPVPQLVQGGGNAVWGSIVGLATAHNARNPQGAIAVAQKLSSQQGTALIANQAGLPPVRRDVSVDTSSNAVLQALVQSALITRGWYDPDKSATDAIFKTMVESVTSGNQDPSAAVVDAGAALTDLLGQ